MEGAEKGLPLKFEAKKHKMSHTLDIFIQICYYTERVNKKRSGGASQQVNQRKEYLVPDKTQWIPGHRVFIVLVEHARIKRLESTHQQCSLQIIWKHCRALRRIVQVFAEI